MDAAQAQALKAFAMADPTAAGYIAAGSDGLLAGWFNTIGTFVVFKSLVQTMDVGKVINYDAVAALTDINANRVQLFTRLNPTTFPPRADIRSFFANVFSGTLAGGGQATRDALDALYRRTVNRAEQALASGAGTTNSPGTLTFEGTISSDDAAQIRTA